MTIKPGDYGTVLDHIRGRLPKLKITGIPESLSGGYLNHVWRVPADPISVIVKYAPPHIATRPDVPLDVERLRIEATAMRTLDKNEALSGLADDEVRPPRLLDFCEKNSVIIMEDVGPFPDLGVLLRRRVDAETQSSLPGARMIGEALGGFIGKLHRRTWGDRSLAVLFDNTGIQKIRKNVLYDSVAGFLRTAGICDAEEIGKRAAEVGEILLGPGNCLTMGDLWPASVIPVPGGLRIIDWELAHYGRPFQDVAHFAAHLWMYARRAVSEDAAREARDCLHGFLQAYRRALEADATVLFGEEERTLGAVHFGSEILIRVLGPFKTGYLYDGLPEDSAVVLAAATFAAQQIRRPEKCTIFSEKGY
jgi:tRNA A-37 threonylcarbamoyl transferase component Bud32